MVAAFKLSGRWGTAGGVRSVVPGVVDGTVSAVDVLGVVAVTEDGAVGETSVVVDDAGVAPGRSQGFGGEAISMSLLGVVGRASVLAKTRDFGKRVRGWSEPEAAMTTMPNDALGGQETTVRSRQMR